MTKAYADIIYKSEDGLDLFARDYGTPERCLGTLFCMHGLTRNSADFQNLAHRYKDRYRVISMDQRGRGRSAYDPDPDHYQPEIYCRDMFALIAHLELTNIIAVGTSMGGIMAMVMMALKPDVFKAVLLNDIGPVVDPTGITRIRTYVGCTGPFKSWAEATQSIKGQGVFIFPNYTDTDWEAFARRVCEYRPDGRVHFAYDPAISEGIRATNPTAVPPDLWAVFSALSTTPLLVVRGATSDLLSSATVSEMHARHNDMQSVEIPDVGHAPMLDEPVAIRAIDSFLKGLM